MRRRRNFILAFIGIVVFISFTARRDGPQPREVRELTETSDGLVTPLNPMYSDTVTLILVPGHGVMRTLNVERDWAREDAWGLEEFQKGRDGFLIRAFSQHIKRALKELKNRGVGKALVVFSGGQTKKSAGPRSEGLSYYMVAEANRLFDVFPPEEHRNVLENRLFAEEFARDSYENLLFSVCRFREVVGTFPQRIVVVNWEYKRQRFEEYHRVAIRWHRSQFEYIGIDINDAAAALGLSVPQSLRNFTDAGTLTRVQSDMYLCNVNAETRAQRNPHRRTIPYQQSCPEIKGLLKHCGPDLYDESLLPWGSIL